MAIPTTAPIEQVHGRAEASPAADPARHPRRPEEKRKRPAPVKSLVTLAVIAAVVGGTYAVLGKERANERFLQAYHLVKEKVAGPEHHPVADAPPPKPAESFNGIIKVTAEERKTIGFRIIPVAAQNEPIKLELNGTTDYDQNTLNKVRPRFDNALIEKVFVSVGQAVKKGDPLVELKSTDLAQAKTDLRTKYVQWDHDHKYLMAREPLAKEGRITQIIWTDTQNDEKKSRLDYLVSRDKLAIYGMTSEQIDKLLEGLGDDKKKALEADDNTQDIARMTMVSPIDGVVVERDVVTGNYYDQKDILLTLSPMDQLWVWGNVFESDQDKVHIRQKWEIVLPFTNERFEGKVESIANGVDPETRTLRIRASIPNPTNTLKARMLVRAILQIAPLPGDTVIPRNALSVVNGEYYAFIQKGEAGEDADLFERRKLEIEQENHDAVIVKKGLKVGDRVVSNGSLILAQMYEDQSTVDSGLPPQ